MMLTETSLTSLICSSQIEDCEDKEKRPKFLECQLLYTIWKIMHYIYIKHVYEVQCLQEFLKQNMRDQ